MRYPLVACFVCCASLASARDLPQGGCRKDVDCKGDRVCVDGECTDPSPRMRRLMEKADDAPRRDAVAARDRDAQAARDREVARLMTKINDHESQMQAEKRKLADELAKTPDAAKKAELQARMAANQAALDKAERDKQAIKAARTVKPKLKSNRPGGAACDPNDPLCSTGELR